MWWKSDSPVSIIEKFCNGRGQIVNIKSIRVGLSWINLSWVCNWATSVDLHHIKFPVTKADGILSFLHF